MAQESVSRSMSGIRYTFLLVGACLNTHKLQQNALRNIAIKECKKHKTDIKPRIYCRSNKLCNDTLVCNMEEIELIK